MFQNPHGGRSGDSTFDTSGEAIVAGLIGQGAVGVGITGIGAPPGTGDGLLGAVAGTAAAGGDGEVVVVGQGGGGLEDDAGRGALGTAGTAEAEGAGGVLGVAEVEGHLGGGAVPRALGHPAVLLDSAPRRPEPRKILPQRRAVGVGGVVVVLVVVVLLPALTRHLLAFHADGSQRPDRLARPPFAVALRKEHCCPIGGRRFEAPVRARPYLLRGAAAWVERVGGSVWVDGRRRHRRRRRRRRFPGRQQQRHREWRGDRGGDERGEDEDCGWYHLGFSLLGSLYP